MDVWAAAGERQRTHGDLVNLSAGQPSTPAPGPVRAAAAKALDSEVLGYTVALGIPPLRAAIAGHYGRAYGLDVAPEDVVVTTGSSGGFLLAFLAAFDVGRPRGHGPPRLPLLPQHPHGAGLRGRRAAVRARDPLPAHRRDARGPRRAGEGAGGRQPGQPDRHRARPRRAGRARAPGARTTACSSISDEIYHGIAYPGAPEPSCAWATSREAIVVNSFSKYFSMTGWRLGWLLLPPRLQRRGRLPRGQLHGLPARPAAGGRPGRVRRRELRRGRRARGPLPGQPRPPARRPRPPRHHPPRARRRRVLRLRRRRAPHRTTRWTSCTGCWPTSGSPSRRAWTSTRSTGHRFIRFSFAGSAADVREALARLERWLGSYAAPHAPPHG